MPESKFHMSLPTDDAASLNGDGAEAVAEGLASVPTPIRKKSIGFVEHSTSVVAAGRLPEEVYENMLPWWRLALRRKCVAMVEWESQVIGEWQVRPFFFFFYPSPFFFLHCPAVGRRLAREAGRRISHCLWQARVRSPWLDTYFLQSSMLGTHTFFLVFLPAFFFFGHDEMGRG
jgi:hypothetical protein